MCFGLFTEPGKGYKTSRNLGTSCKMIEDSRVREEREIELISK